MEQIGKDCMKLIETKIANEITSDEYYLGLMELHKKYPLNCDPNFYDVAQIYAKKIPLKQAEREIQRRNTETLR